MFWFWHAWCPFVFFAVSFFVLEFWSLDRPIAQSWAFDSRAQHWLGSGAGDWWAHRLLHTGGGWMVRGLAGLALGAWLLSFRVPQLLAWRRFTGFVVLAMLLATGVVGALKSVTNVDCPWDLQGFGGNHPYVALFADRPDTLPRAKCFPGAHASSGFALMCFYFVLRDRSRRLARWALVGAAGVGVIFSIGQEARGAHFISHDLVSAAIVWCVQLALYVWMFRRSTGAKSATA